jgi:hypothetical protein
MFVFPKKLKGRSTFKLKQFVLYMQKSILKKILLALNIPKCTGFIKRHLLGLNKEAITMNSTLKKIGAYSKQSLWQIEKIKSKK